LKITISADGTPDPPGSVDYVTESIQPDGSKLRHYVCRQCLEVVDAQEDAETVHVCAEGDSAAAGAGN